MAQFAVAKVKRLTTQHQNVDVKDTLIHTLRFVNARAVSGWVCEWVNEFELHGDKKNWKVFESSRLKKLLENHLEDLCVNAIIVLEWILGK
jgi:hypothetical protein